MTLKDAKVCEGILGDIKGYYCILRDTKRYSGIMRYIKGHRGILMDTEKCEEI